ncbi:hypothetical protein BaRGS_00031775 [Batillaria attramentaria]|uniref:ODAD1 central coiled coil region domain-containing protein n=1 Tax=Batillaria attramentaria TaxID=370345 RepID=A0ABD0JQD8_9CAEN
MFKKRTMMLMVGQRAERLREERIRNEESIRMRKDIRSLRRTRGRDERSLGVFLGYQNKWMDGLQSEAGNMDRDIKTTKCHCYQLEDERDTTRLMHWVERNDAVKAEIAKTRAKIADLKHQIFQVESELNDTKKALGRRKKGYANVRVPEIWKVMDRLDIAIAELGEGTRENRRLVSEIHHLTTKKARLQEMFLKEELELTKVNRDLSENIDVATDTYKLMENTKRNMANVNDHYQHTKAAFELDMDNLQFKIDVLRRNEAFILEKNKPREDEFAEQRALLLARQNPVTKEIQKYVERLKEIKEKTEGQPLDQIANTFVELVLENWMLFQNVQLTKDRNHEMIHYIAGVKDMLDKLEYTPEEISRLSGIFHGVHEENVLVFLGEIENYVNKLWGLQDYVEYSAWENRRRKSLIPGAVKPKGPRPPRRSLMSVVPVLPPNYERSDAYEDTRSLTDLDIVPFDYEEIYQHVCEELISRHDSALLVVTGDTSRKVSDANTEPDSPLPSPGALTSKDFDVF